jgi:hypothetical protein
MLVKAELVKNIWNLMEAIIIEIFHIQYRSKLGLFNLITNRKKIIGYLENQGNIWINKFLSVRNEMMLEKILRLWDGNIFRKHIF